MPVVPAEPVREGSRWRYHKPDGDEIAEWFRQQPIDEGMDHAEFVSGVVIIPAQEKVKVQREDGRGIEDRHEMTFTPYVRVDTRISYFRKLAAKDGLIAVIEPVKVPESEEEATDNRHMPPGFWWHVVRGDGSVQVRYLCCTMRVALYDRERWECAPASPEAVAAHEGGALRPLREGIATKQVVAKTDDPNALAKAETGAVGRALGMAGILVIGTGLATAEDMAELREQPQAAPALPEMQSQETAEEISERLLNLSGELRERSPEKWTEFSAWWQERQSKEGWSAVDDAPIEVRRGLVRRLQAMLVDVPPMSQPPDEGAQHDSSPGVEDSAQAAQGSSAQNPEEQ